MSLPAIVWVFKQTVKPASLKLTLLALAECANSETLECYPSTKYIAHFTNLDRKTILENMDKIRKMGFLVDTGKRTGRTKQVRVYKFNMGLAKSTENGTVSNERVGISPEQVAKTDFKRSQCGHPEPLLEPLKKPKDFFVKLKKEGISDDKIKIFIGTKLSDDGCTLFAPTEFARARIENFYTTPLANIGVKNIQLMG